MQFYTFILLNLHGQNDFLNRDDIKDGGTS